MEDLRAFLVKRAPRNKEASDGYISWQSLSKKLLELREDVVLQKDGLSSTAVTQLSDDKLRKELNNSKECRLVDGEKIVNLSLEILQRVVHRSKPPYVYVPSELVPLVDLAISTLNVLNQRLRILFFQRFIKIKGTCPVQLLWLLQNAGIVEISSYTCQHEKIMKEETTACSHIPKAVVWLLTQPSQSSDDLNMGRDILASLLLTSQGGLIGGNQDLAAISVTILQQFTELIVKWVLHVVNSPSSKTDPVFHVTYLSSHELQEACGQDAVRWFALTHLLQLLSDDYSSSNSMLSISEAARNQEKNWTLESCPTCLRDLITMIVSILGVKNIVHHIGGAVVKPFANWKIMLLVTSILIKTFPESCDDLKGLTEELLRVGLEGGRQLELSAALLLARQCCSQRCLHFLSYSSWFSSHFGADSVTARSPVQYQSLLQVLTELVPVETADTLRVHLNKVPQAPTNCNALLHDYTVLARTRLSDLNESTELAGLFGNRQDTLAGMDLRMSDLCKVLEHFQRTNEVMKPVFEAAIFRPQYYRDIFLADLLGLTETSFQLNEDLECIRHDFILVLKSLNKIPEKLMKDYLKKRLPRPHETISKAKGDDSRVDTSGSEIKPEKKKKSLHVKQKRQS